MQDAFGANDASQHAHRQRQLDLSFIHGRGQQRAYIYLCYLQSRA